MPVKSYFSCSNTSYIFNRFVLPLSFIFSTMLILIAVVFLMVRDKNFQIVPFVIVLSCHLFFFYLFRDQVLTMRKVEVTDRGIHYDNKDIKWSQVRNIKQFFVLRVDIDYVEGDFNKRISFPNYWESIAERSLWPRESGFVQKLKELQSASLE